MATQTFTFDNLMALLLSYSERNDTTFSAQRETFIAMAENRLSADLKQQGFQTLLTGELTASTALVKPTGWRETLSFRVRADEDAPWQPVYLRALEIVQVFANEGATGLPRYYADRDISSFLLTSTVDEAEYELVYYAKLAPLAAANQTNWLTTHAPQAMVYAMMLEAAIWRRSQEDTAKYQGLYDAAKSSLVVENMERLADRNLVVTKG